MYTYLTNNMKMLIWMKCHMFQSNEHCMCILISQYHLSYDILSSLLLKDQTLLLEITTALSFDCFCWLTFDENFRIHFKFASNYRIRYSINIIFSWICIHFAYPFTKLLWYSFWYNHVTSFDRFKREIVYMQQYFGIVSVIVQC